MTMRTPQKPPTPPPTPLLPNELARREGADTRVRPDPLRVRWNFADLVTLDGHRLKLTSTCSVRALDNPTERQMLAETFLGSRGGDRAAPEAVRRHPPDLAGHHRRRSADAGVAVRPRRDAPDAAPRRRQGAGRAIALGGGRPEPAQN